MNPNNYASLEASKRLVEAGIEMETEMNRWVKDQMLYLMCKTYHFQERPASRFSKRWSGR